MSRLIETIRVLDGEFNNLAYHQDRMRRAWKSIFQVEEPFELKPALQRYEVPAAGLYKCRMVYDVMIRLVEFVPYEFKKVNSLKLVIDDEISYPHKFENRIALQNHFALRGNYDDVLIIKEGFVTDTSFANIVFKRGKDWLTPSTCLLPGTMRQSLLDRGIIKEEEIRGNEVHRFETFRLVNSMLTWDGPEVSTSAISK